GEPGRRQGALHPLPPHERGSLLLRREAGTRHHDEAGLRGLGRAGKATQITRRRSVIFYPQTPPALRTSRSQRTAQLVQRAQADQGAPWPPIPRRPSRGRLRNEPRRCLKAVRLGHGDERPGREDWQARGRFPDRRTFRSALHAFSASRLGMAELDEVATGERTPGLLQAATGCEAAEIDRREAETLDQLLDECGRFGMVSRDEDSATSSVLDRPFIETGGHDRIERLDDASTWGQGRHDLAGALAAEIGEDELRTRLGEGIRRAR